MPGRTTRSQKRHLEAPYIAFRGGLRFARGVPSRDNFNPHSRTFSIDPASAAKRQRLPSNLVIENPRQHTFGFHLHRTRRAFPMNANGKPETEINHQ